MNSRLAQRPSTSTVDICKIAYKIISRCDDLDRINYQIVRIDILDILNAVSIDEIYGDIDFEHNLSHKSELISLVIDEYSRIHLTHLAQCLTFENQLILIGMRTSKIKHFAGQ